MNLFYETTLASKLGGRHPLHVIIMSVTMAALQGFLNPASGSGHTVPTGIAMNAPHVL